MELLADGHRHEPDVRPDAHPRPAGPAAAHVRLPSAPARVLQPRLLEPGRRPIGAFILAIGVLLFLINVVRTDAQGRRSAPLDPWDARSLEWMTTSPPKEHNFDAIPTVHTLDEFFHRKYEEDEETGRAAPGRHGRGDPRRAGGPRRPRTSTCRRRRTGRWSWRSACRSSASALIYNHVIAVVGGIVILLGVYGWALEPSVADPRTPTTTRRPEAGTSKELATIG